LQLTHSRSCVCCLSLSFRSASFIAAFVFLADDLNRRWLACICLQLLFLLSHVHLRLHGSMLDNEVEQLCHVMLMLVLLLLAFLPGSAAASVAVLVIVYAVIALLAVYVLFARLRKHLRLSWKKVMRRQSSALQSQKRRLSQVMRISKAPPLYVTDPEMQTQIAQARSAAELQLPSSGPVSESRGTAQSPLRAFDGVVFQTPHGSTLRPTAIRRASAVSFQSSRPLRSSLTGGE
jgi:hypothetical protein